MILVHFGPVKTDGGGGDRCVRFEKTNDLVSLWMDGQKGGRFAETNDTSNEKDCQINSHKDYFSQYHITREFICMQSRYHSGVPSGPPLLIML